MGPMSGSTNSGLRVRQVFRACRTPKEVLVQVHHFIHKTEKTQRGEGLNGRQEQNPSLSPGAQRPPDLPALGSARGIQRPLDAWLSQARTAPSLAREVSNLLPQRATKSAPSLGELMVKPQGSPQVKNLTDV